MNPVIMNIALMSILCLVPCFSNTGAEELVKMKIVEEPSNYGMNNYNFGNQYQGEEPKLKMRIQPRNFSGPLHFKHFVGKCFKKEITTYKYEFCPFSNVTQHELTYRWNPFSGVLGVWQEWEISNNTFVAMVMREGEKCGDIYRSIKIKFFCGEKNDIKNVTEPSTCNYEMMFSTPYVCHKHSMLVYPTLNDTLQKEWDQIETELYREEITVKGYNKRLHKLFEKAGYYLSKETQNKISKEAVHKEQTKEKEDKGEFESLSKCTEEYQKLKKEIEGIRTVIAIQENKEEENARKKEEEDKAKKISELKNSRREKKISKFKEIFSKYVTPAGSRRLNNKDK